MKRIEEFTQEEKLSILGGSTGGATLDEGDCLGVFGGGCKEGCKPGCKDGCKESCKTTTVVQPDPKPQPQPQPGKGIQKDLGVAKP